MSCILLKELLKSHGFTLIRSESNRPRYQPKIVMRYTYSRQQSGIMYLQGGIKQSPNISYCNINKMDCSYLGSTLNGVWTHSIHCLLAITFVDIGVSYVNGQLERTRSIIATVKILLQWFFINTNIKPNGNNQLN